MVEARGAIAAQPVKRIERQRPVGPPAFRFLKESTMGIADKFENKAEELKGKAKEHIGAATNNRDLEAEGNADQAKAAVKQAGEHVKDAAKDVTGR